MEGNVLNPTEVISVAGIVISVILAVIVLIGIISFSIKKIKRTVSSSSDKADPEAFTKASTDEIDLGDAYDGSDGRGMTGM
jgi:hypothetical protein